MKSMRKMVLAGMVLLASVMFLVGCDTNAGGGGNEEPNNGYIKPMLPESSGKDPFEGKTLLIYDEWYRFRVDTSSKTLVCQILKEDSTSNKVYVDYVKWTYSYDILTDTPIITLRYESGYDMNKREFLTIPEYIDYKAEMASSSKKYDFATAVSKIWEVSNEEEKQKEIHKLNEEYNLNLTIEDFSEENIAATLEKSRPVVEKKSQEAGQKIKKYSEELFSRLATYAITLEKTENDEDEIVFEGKYDSNYEWYNQITGAFTGDGAYFNWFFNYIIVDGKHYSVTSITGDQIHCEGEGETKTFSYEKSQIEPNSDMTIIVRIGDKLSIPCIWKPDTFVALPPI